MFIEERESTLFNWDMIGDIKTGRPNLGAQMNVAVYRLMQYTLRDIMIKDIGVQKADSIMYEAGHLGGTEFFKNVLTQKDNLDAMIKELEEVFLSFKIGIIRFEKVDPQKLEFVIVVEEDLDCSGLPVCNEAICTYDEGFIAGIFESFSSKKFVVKEVDCWCTGERVCRFTANPQKEDNDI